MELAAEAFGVQLQYLDVREPKDIETAFRAATKERADESLRVTSPLFSQRTRFLDLAVKNRLPAIYNDTRICRGRGPYDLRRELYRLVPPRRHLRGQNPKGAKPADLPVEQPKNSSSSSI